MPDSYPQRIPRPCHYAFTYIHVIVPLFAKEDLWRDHFWHQRCELQDYFRNYFSGVPREIILELAEKAGILVNGIAAGKEGILDTNLCLVQDKFSAMVQRYEKGLRYNPAENMLGSPITQ